MMPDQDDGAARGESPGKVHVASVVLSYNGDADVRVLLPQLRAQRGVRHSVIVVDNASNSASVECLRACVQAESSKAVIGSVQDVSDWAKANPAEANEDGRIYLLLNHENRGYSAGNNIGIRFAALLGAEAVLIANPDMRIDNPRYLERLSVSLFAEPGHCIAASRIVGLDGAAQSPLREPNFREELLWPRFYLARFFTPVSYVLSIEGTEAVQVPKVSGCCMLVRMSFLRATGNLDEGVFLYCEEPILSARVRNNGGCIICVPDMVALHAHARKEKGGSARRMKLFVESRKYYLERYSGYNAVQRTLLSLSYELLLGVCRWRKQ